VNITEGAIAASSHLEEPIRAERLEQHAESLAAADHKRRFQLCFDAASSSGAIHRSKDRC
jgi:hypothetical protein